MEIIKVVSNKKAYLHLLFIGDEQEDMIDRYLERGEMFLLRVDGCDAGVCVVTDEGGGLLEIKNIALDPVFQGRGYGKQMISHVAKTYQSSFEYLTAGTGETPSATGFYTKCGFRYDHRIKDFFTTHYREPIIEEGVLLTDMVYYKMKL